MTILVGGVGDLIIKKMDAWFDTLGEDGAYFQCQNNFGDTLADQVWEEYMEITKKRVRKPKEVKSFLVKTLREAFPSMKFKNVEGEVGLEIEAEGKSLFNTPIQYWTAVTDNSLRAIDGHNPLEYVLREPIPRTEVRTALEYLRGCLKSVGSQVMMSHRCSVHVHVNLQNMSMKDIINYICLYYIFENILMEISGPERKGNLFCLRGQDAEFQIENVVQAIKQNRWVDAFNQEYRYAGLNISSISKHGSLEFRALKGTVDIDYITAWTDILLYLKDISSIFTTPEDISRQFTTFNPRGFFNKTFDKLSNVVARKFLEEQSKLPDFKDQMWASYRVMRDICHAIDWLSPPSYMTSTTTRKTKNIMFVDYESSGLPTPTPPSHWGSIDSGDDN